MRAFDQPASRKTRACSGDTTSSASVVIGNFGWVSGSCDYIAARAIDFVYKSDRDRLPSRRFVQRAIESYDAFDGAILA